MSEPLSFTPAGRCLGSEAGSPVHRRHVLFIPGYDPEAEGRYRKLFVREMIRYAKRFGLARREISRIDVLPEVPALRWDVVVGTDRWTTRTEFEVLRWDDIVLADFRRPLPVVIVLLFAGVFSSLVTGTMVKFWRLNWKFGGVILYPAVMVLAFLAASFGIGLAVDALLSSWFPAGPLARWALVLGVAGLSFSALYRLGERWFVWHLMHDWVFNFQHGMGWRPDYQLRVERFARRLSEAMRDSRTDEVLVVGHSSGSTMAVDIVAEALSSDPHLTRERPELALLTLGSCVPIVALNPVARRYRDGMRRIMTEPGLFWAEYQAPQDWINFAGFNPARDLGLGIAPATCRNPTIRSTRFKEIVAEKTYQDIVFKPFRMHFQFLMANDRAGEYDFLMMTAGPITLRERIRLGDASAETVLGVVLPSDPSRDKAVEPAKAEGLTAAAIKRDGTPPGSGLDAIGAF